jgi:hypothetical protein
MASDSPLPGLKSRSNDGWHQPLSGANSPFPDWCCVMPQLCLYGRVVVVHVQAARLKIIAPLSLERI